MAHQNQSKQLVGTVIILLGAIFLVVSLIVLQEGINETTLDWAMISQFQLSEDSELRTWWPVAIIGVGVFLVLSPKKDERRKVDNKERIKISNK